MIAGHEQPTEGDVQIRGRNVRGSLVSITLPALSRAVILV
jgi:ABC-type Fe3+/spermidine/putrescine transport system ATPase subunit